MPEVPTQRGTTVYLSTPWTAAEAWFPKPLLSVPTSAQGDNSADDTGVAAFVAELVAEESLFEKTLRQCDNKGRSKCTTASVNA